MVLQGSPQDLQNEDLLQECVLGRPSVHQHYAVFSKPSDPFFIRWLALRDAFYQHGWQFPQFVKHAWTGASLGVFFGFYHYMTQTYMEPLLFNKAQHFSKRAGLFGPALVAAKAMSPYISIGALLGIAYHGFFNVILQQDHEYTLFKDVAGHTLFCGVVGGSYNLRFFWFSALVGLLYGFLHYESSQGYVPYMSKSDPGFFYELPGLTKEQREVYKNRDKITRLSTSTEFIHSKNNTANPVFTYAERKMIKDFGKQKARIGSDSQKPFEFCYLCVTKVVDPLCCCKGHIFCRECIINNLVKQKEDNAKLLEAYEKQQKLLEQKKQEDDQAQQKQREQDFEKLDYQNDILERKHFKSKVEQKMQGYIHQDQDMQFRALDQMKQKGNEMLTRTKEDLISKNFWVPDTQKAEEPKIMNQPSKTYKCPATKDHEVKMRKLYKVQFNENSKEVFCYACNKTLRYQKTAMSKHCGHVMCLDCLNKMCLPDERCLVCSIPFKKSDIISLQESSSGFSSHNQVEVTVFNPVMLI